MGGGSGGHIYPNLAVAERLRERDVVAQPHLVVSKRQLDAEIAAASGVPFTAVPASPLGLRPRTLWRFLHDHHRGVAAVSRLIAETRAAAVLCTGGFVSGPAVVAAIRAKVPVALVSLDAVPGKANRAAARRADKVFVACSPAAGGPSRRLKDAEAIGYPLRRSAVANEPPTEARVHLGLEPQRPTLLVFAGSQGARTINAATATFVSDPEAAAALQRWQVLHVAGNKAGAVEALQDAYAAGGLHARVVAFCDRMDRAWAAADLAVTRAGAGTVAEAWINAVPCIMLPYPFHRDQHQRHNAAPLETLGGAIVLTDLVEPARNCVSLRHHLIPLLHDPARRALMRQSLSGSRPRDGAASLADWVERQVAAGQGSHVPPVA